MKRKVLLIVLIFLVTGEILIRVDKVFQTRVVKISTEMLLTPEHDMLNRKTIDFSGNSLRVLVIGDSYIAGGGIDYRQRFSVRLKEILARNNKRYRNIYVLDVSRSSSNCLDNYQTYRYYSGRFRPDVVVLGYNINDIQGNLEKPDPAAAPDSVKLVSTNSSKTGSLTKKIYKFYKQSKLLEYCLSKLHNELKAKGMVIPNSVFDLTLKSYAGNKENWKKAKALLTEMEEDAGKRGIKLIVLKFPEINLLEFPALFEDSENAIQQFFTTLPSVRYVKGADIFKGEKSEDYMLSKYDGHPNEKAHLKMAVKIADLIPVR